MGRFSTAYWMSAAFAGALLLAVPVLAVMGAGPEGTDAALRVTARWSLLLFWPAYTGRALKVLFGPTFDGIARHSRDFGLSFAAAHLVHITLILWMYQGLGKHPIPHFVVVYDTVALVMIYTMALLSIPTLQAWLRPWQWRLFRDVTMHFVALIFALDLVMVPLKLGTNHPMGYIPFSILAILGPLLRFAAMVRGWFTRQVAVA